tara:strand:- start:217 stop:444 length:228 start_codon:yes stop_codon:yes gene_type:complete
MSTHIEMDEDYNQTTYYYGALNEDYHFCAPVRYNSISEEYKTKKIKWTEEPKRKLRIKAEKKINDFLLKWLFDRL